MAPCSDSVSLRLLLIFGLTLLPGITSRLIMQKARRHPDCSRLRLLVGDTVSGTISLPSQGFFSPFPHGTGSLSVAKKYLALRDGPRCFPQDSSCPVVLGIPGPPFSLSSTGLSPSTARLSSTVRLGSRDLRQVPQPRPRLAAGPVWALSISLAATPEIDFSFSSFRY